jgi:hypothetical protein
MGAPIKCCGGMEHCPPLAGVGGGLKLLKLLKL